MKSDELLDFLRDEVRAPIESHTQDILDTIGDDEERRRQFELDLLYLDQLIGKLEVQQFKNIAARLKELSPSLEAGAKAMKASLQKVKGFAKAADTFASVVGLVARIVALA